MGSDFGGAVVTFHQSTPFDEGISSSSSAGLEPPTGTCPPPETEATSQACQPILCSAPGPLEGWYRTKIQVRSRENTSTAVTGAHIDRRDRIKRKKEKAIVSVAATTIVQVDELEA